ncbi:MAG TPA: hypothetical protein VGM25_06035 [Caulobacteraceae bacterium]|jgi:hypothetical protein
MAKFVTLKTGQFLLLVVSLFLIGAAAGIMGAGLYWHVHGFVTLAAPAEILGMAAFIVFSIWKIVDDWAVRTGYKPLGFD